MAVGESMADAVFMPVLMFGGMVLMMVAACLTMVGIGATEWFNSRLGSLRVRSSAASSQEWWAVVRQRVSGLLDRVSAAVPRLLTYRIHWRDSHRRLVGRVLS